MPFDDGGLLLSWPLRSFDNFLAIFRACRARPHRDKLTETETGAHAHAQTERPEERLVIPLVGPAHPRNSKPRRGHDCNLGLHWDK